MNNHSRSIRRRVWELVEVAKPGDTASHVFDIAIFTLILLNAIAVVAGSVKAVQERFAPFLNLFETVSVLVFTVEYAARLWSCAEEPGFRGVFTGRARFALRPLSVIDFLAILPFFLPFTGLDLRSFRVLRLFRILRIVKLARYSTAVAVIGQVFRSKKEELVILSAALGMLLVMASSLLYYFENPAQPEAYSSIPAAMWWAVCTLTTVGYGDVYPVTTMGKVFASLIAILGIGMFALPAGILGSGFLEAVHKSGPAAARVCPHCGKEIA